MRFRPPASIVRRGSLLLLGLLCGNAAAQAPAQPAHGVWIWKTASVLGAPGSVNALREFCARQRINEVYLSFASAQGRSGHESGDALLARVNQSLHRAGVHVEALLSSVDADEPGKPREKLLNQIREIAEFNGSHPGAAFDGVHLDIEPQQRAENKGPGNLDYLSGLVETYRAAWRLARSAHLSMNADIQKKLLRGNLEQRRSLLSSSPRLTLMLYEVGGGTAEDKEKKLRDSSEEFMQMAYQGLNDRGLATMSIALRVPDYGKLLPRMLQTLDDTLRNDPHYAGWAWHSWNDSGGD